MIYKRKIYDVLLKHAQSRFATVITGMRRTGKTTLIKSLLADSPNKNSLFLDLERLDNREIFLQKNYDIVLDILADRGLNTKSPMLVALDEVQFVKEVPSVVKYLSDHYDVKFVITGSSSFYLKNVFNESLAGRKKIFELYPLDFGEYLTFRGVEYGKGRWEAKKMITAEVQRLSGYYEDYIRFGGFPQVVLASSIEEKRDLLSDIMSSYINVDVSALADFTDTRNLYNLTKILAQRVGSRIDASKLSRLTGISRPTVMNYLEFLEKTYLIATVKVKVKSPDREIVKAKKLYFVDTGLANYLAELSSGAQFENTLYGQLSRQTLFLGIEDEVRYYALKTGQEIDFIYHGLAFEAKERPIEQDLAPLARLAGLAGVDTYRLIGRYATPKFGNYIWGGSIT